MKAARPVIALDPPGEPGGSTHTRPFADGRDLAGWLDQVLTGLNIDRAHLIGTSNGGWIAMQHALHRPGRAATLTLLDPAGFGRITGRFLRWVILGGLASHAPDRLRRRMAGKLRNVTLLDDDLVRLVKLSTAYRRRLPLPPPLTDAELAALTLPVHLMLGEHSVMYDAQQVAQHAARVMPDVRVEVVKGASHDLPLHSVDLVTARAIDLARTTEPIS
ncbi:alpha/beta fold hydrolase [Dactylosporangium sp. NPDC051484]|uniref:alpha/beta fold hydrolase n=1 Tax=Dactylosporangium sp. NPDC051484 TaxID=3154942 RepID=UPI003450E10D